MSWSSLLQGSRTQLTWGPLESGWGITRYQFFNLDGNWKTSGRRTPAAWSAVIQPVDHQSVCRPCSPEGERSHTDWIQCLQNQQEYITTSVLGWTDARCFIYSAFTSYRLLLHLLCLSFIYSLAHLLCRIWTYPCITALFNTFNHSPF